MPGASLTLVCGLLASSGGVRALAKPKGTVANLIHPAANLISATVASFHRRPKLLPLPAPRKSMRRHTLHVAASET